MSDNKFVLLISQMEKEIKSNWDYTDINWESLMNNPYVDPTRIIRYKAIKEKQDKAFLELSTQLQRNKSRMLRIQRLFTPEKNDLPVHNLFLSNLLSFLGAM